MTYEIFEGNDLKFFDKVSEQDIEKVILSMPNKSCLLDPIPTDFTKSLLPELLPLFTTRSRSRQLANVEFIHKSGD